MSARDEIVGLIAGSDERIRPIAERVADGILAKYAHELAEKIRGANFGDVHYAANLIDPEVER